VRPGNDVDVVAQGNSVVGVFLALRPQLLGNVDIELADVGVALADLVEDFL
jgi:hypothetical protein